MNCKGCIKSDFLFVFKQRCKCLVYLSSTLLLLTFFYASPLQANTEHNDLQFVRLLVDKGISIGSVEAIFQDSEGFMWFGGLEGLVRYDGYNFVTYRYSP